MTECNNESILEGTLPLTSGFNTPKKRPFSSIQDSDDPHDDLSVANSTPKRQKIRQRNLSVSSVKPQLPGGYSLE